MKLLIIILLYIFNNNAGLCQFTRIEAPRHPGGYLSFSDGLMDFGDMMNGFYSAYAYISPSGGGEYWLFRTNDGGATWSERISFSGGPGFQNYFLFSVNQEICFSAFNTEGYDRVYKVTDNEIYTIFYDIYFTPRSMTKLNDSILYLTVGLNYFPPGHFSNLYRIEGDSSHLVYSKNSDSLVLLKPLFINPDTGFIISKYPYNTSYSILRTFDAGNSWQSCFMNDSLEITDICFFNQSTGIISCSGGYLFRTSDTGNNWESIKLNTPNGISSLSFIDDNTGYCGGDGGSFYLTFDNGQSWNSLNFPFNYDISRLKMMAFNQGYIQTDGGYYRYTDTLSMIETKTIAPVRIYPNPANSAITIEFFDDSFTNYEFRLINTSGNTFFSGIRSEDRFTLDLTGCAKGIYILEIIRGDDRWMKKVIVL